MQQQAIKYELQKLDSKRGKKKSQMKYKPQKIYNQTITTKSVSLKNYI